MTEDQATRYAKFQRLGRTKFIMLYGVCYWGFLTGLLWGIAMTACLSLPAYLLLALFHWQPSTAELWLLFATPLTLGLPAFMYGGVWWGQRVWDECHKQFPNANVA